MKILHVAAPSSQEAERFAREARLLATLEHPNIVRYVAHGQTGEGQPFLAMDWLDGHELAHHLEQHQLTLAESLQVTRQVASALCLAHRRGIVHRDIKPSKIPSVESVSSGFPKPSTTLGKLSADSICTI